MGTSLNVHLKKLDAHLQKRVAELKRAKEGGVKVVGYYPGSFVPEEIIYASGAVPLCLADGGDSSLVEASLSVMPRRFCSFVRAQIGGITEKNNPYFELLDLLVAPISCQHMKKLGEMIEFRHDVDILKLGIPHSYENKAAIEYYEYQLEKLKNRLQVLTGNDITNEKLIDAIELYNSMRDLFREISYMRTNAAVSISSLDFVKLNHASFYADPAFMVDVLRDIVRDLKEQQLPEPDKKPRLLLLGPNLAYGDYKVLDLLEAAGGEVVVEEITEGLRSYWQNIGTDEAPITSLANGYLRDRVPCAFMVNTAKKRLDFALKLIEDFNVDGALWYELICCETYDNDSYYFANELGKKNIPVLILESDYGTSDLGQLKTRIDAFIELLRGGI